MHRALYRKWRPRDFDDVCGQEQITDILRYEVAEGKTTHAYLFCGSRGTGKTSCAKILAKAVNCLSPRNGNPCNECEACRAIESGTTTDVIEMDAASNTGVDNVRDIKDEIAFTPAEMKYRVYIIDEVHMMSGSAFNALLKTLEEPPSHVKFILATTELHKLPSTIVSRCQRFDFRRLSSDVIVSRLMKIAAAEEIDLREDGARLLARMALGGMRDAISLLELCAGMRRTVDSEMVVSILGAGNRALLEKLVRAVAGKDYSTIYGIIADEVMSSRDISVFFRDLIEYYRDMLVVKTAKEAKTYLDLTDVEMASLSEIAATFSLGALLYQSRLLEGAYASMQRGDASKRAIAELTLTRMCEPKLSDTSESLVARIEALEGELARLKYGGSIAPAPAPAPEAEAAKIEKTEQKSEAEPMPAPAPTPRASAAPAASGAPVFRAIPGWSEIVLQFSRTHQSSGAFLDTARAYRSDDGKVYLIRVSSDFSARMLARPDVEGALRVAIGEALGRDISDAQLRIEAATKKNDYHLIDEVEEALSENNSDKGDII